MGGLTEKHEIKREVMAGIEGSESLPATRKSKGSVPVGKVGVCKRGNGAQPRARRGSLIMEWSCSTSYRAGPGHEESNGGTVQYKVNISLPVSSP